MKQINRLFQIIALLGLSFILLIQMNLYTQYAKHTNLIIDDFKQTNLKQTNISNQAVDSQLVNMFEDVTTVAGITATHHISYSSYYGIGQAWGDYNGDGWLDLYVTDNDGPNTLYKNNGDGTFSISSLSTQVALPTHTSSGAVFADYDNDGWRDLYVLAMGPNKLFHNDGGTGFTDVTAIAGVGDTNIGETGSWGDYDQDGYLDLFVANWGSTRDTLYHNNGDGTFTDVTTDTLNYIIASRDGFVGSFVDYDNDGDLDIYVVNDKMDGNVLWRNDGPGCNHWCFIDAAPSSGADAHVNGMGLAIGDYDSDSDLDFYFSDIGPSTLLQNQTSQGSPTFINVSEGSGTDDNVIGWGNVFFDYNNDGWLDLYLAVMNDYAAPEPDEPNRLFQNLGNQTFIAVSEGSGAADPGISLGVAYADYDNDGWLDLIIGNRGGRYALYHNLGLSTNHWVSFHLIGGGPINRDAIGSRVYLTTSDGRTLMQEVKSGSSLGSGNDTTLHFGLGVTTIEQVKIVWPDGVTQILNNITPNKSWRLVYPIDLQKTVGLNANQCATTQNIAIMVSTTVTYCYTITNNSYFTFTNHTLIDSHLGMLYTNSYTLPPNSSLSITQTAFISETTINTATWIASDIFSNTTTATDVATVSLITIFENVNASTGISTAHHINGNYLGTGQAWGDYNQDGWLDLYLTDNNGPNTLYKNNGDGTFSISELSNQVALVNNISGGAVFADYDNDGWPDLYVTNWGVNALFHNQMGNGFVNIANSAGVADVGRGESAAWGDYNQDGLLDLYVTNWGDRDRLYHNNGDHTFLDITDALGTSQPDRFGFIGSFTDYDNDGDPDIYVVNDKLGGNVLWQNNGPGCLYWCFTDVSNQTNTDTKGFGMGLAIGDYDADQDLDFYFSDIGPSTLLQNQTSQGYITFTDVSTASATNPDVVGWGAFFFDYDNDGWSDLYLATMMDYTTPGPESPNRLFNNLGNATFADVSPYSGADDNRESMGVAYADYNQDGFIDFVVANRGVGYTLYQNLGYVGDNHNWLTVKLIGGGPINRDAIGSRVYLTTTDGHIQMQEVKSGSSLGSGNDTALHFGLGQATIEQIDVVWADSFTQTFTQIDPNQILYLTYPYPNFTLQKTVGTQANNCATTNAITITVATSLTYCYTITNTGAFTFNTHTLTDSQLGTIANNLVYTLPPGSSFYITQTALLTQTTINTAVWVATDTLGNIVTATHTANVILQQIPTTFIDVTTEAGLIFNHHVYTGYADTGHAWGDYNQDGWPDVYLTNSNGPNVLYQNNGDSSFSVSQLSAQVALTTSVSGGTIFGDYNNDGWLDLYVLNWGSNTLFHNNAGLSFTDVTTTAGVGDISKSQSAAWGDYNHDGYLDLYVANWAYQDKLYHNNGDGSFTDVSNILPANATNGFGFVASFVDYDNDGDLDIYLVNDKLDGNKLWRNDGPGCTTWCFTNISIQSGTDTQVYGMGLAIGDYDADSDLDFYFSDAGPSTLLQNQSSQGSPNFLDVSAASDSNANVIGGGTFFFDYDNDGWLDLYLAVTDDMDIIGTSAPNRLMRNLTDGTFENVSLNSGVDNNQPSISVSYIDYNQDGWLDVLVGNTGNGYYLYQNTGLDNLSNNWLKIKLIGGNPINHNAVGSRVYVNTDNSHTQLQELKLGSSIGVNNDPTLHFGLGEALLQSVKVVWSNGLNQLFNNLSANKQWQIIYPLNLEVTVGTNTTACPANNNTLFISGDPITYCYKLTNSSAITFNLHNLIDSHLGTIATDFPHTLAPGSSFYITQTTTLTQTTLNTATWLANSAFNDITMATQGATATLALPSITLSKTVGLMSTSCPSTSVITVTEGSQVFYCYTIKNTGNITLPIHSLIDSELGTVFTDVTYHLAPAEQINTVDLGQLITATIDLRTTNVATWTTSLTTSTLSTLAVATATVNITPTIIIEPPQPAPSIILTKTVQSDSSTCGVQNTLILPGSLGQVTHCYIVQNTGNITFTIHSLTDKLLGTLLTDFNHTLAPGDVYSYLTTTLVTTNSNSLAIWTAIDSTETYSATATATTTITTTPIINPQDSFIAYLPLILK